jgi:hypothetical protein
MKNNLSIPEVINGLLVGLLAASTGVGSCLNKQETPTASMLGRAGKDITTLYACFVGPKQLRFHRF